MTLDRHGASECAIGGLGQRRSGHGITNIPAVPNSDSPWDRGARNHVAMVAMTTALAAQSDLCSTLHYFSYDMGDRSTITQTFFVTFLHRLYTEGDAEVLSN